MKLIVPPSCTAFRSFVVSFLAVCGMVLFACGDDGNDSVTRPDDGESSSSSSVILSSSHKKSSSSSFAKSSSSRVTEPAEVSSSSKGRKSSSSSKNKESSSSVKVEESSSSVNVEESSSSEKVEVISSSSIVQELPSSAKIEESSSSEKPAESSSSEKVVESSSSEKSVELSSSDVVSSSSIKESSSSSLVAIGVCKTELEDHCTYGSLYDERDGQTYKTVKIGEQWWMAENLKFEDADSTRLKCQNDNPNNCVTYGYLYNREAATNACPNEWRLPNKSDLSELRSYINKYRGNLTQGQALRSKDGGWDKTGVGEGADLFGFNVLPGGGWYDNIYKFANASKRALFWQSDSTEVSSSMQYCYMEVQSYLCEGCGVASGKDFIIGSRYVDNIINCDREMYLYIRCIKDN